MTRDSKASFVVELNADEINAVVGGVYGSEQIDPKTGQVIIVDCTGREIGSAS